MSMDVLAVLPRGGFAVRVESSLLDGSSLARGNIVMSGARASGVCQRRVAHDPGPGPRHVIGGQAANRQIDFEAGCRGHERIRTRH